MAFLYSLAAFVNFSDSKHDLTKKMKPFILLHIHSGSFENVCLKHPLTSQIEIAMEIYPLNLNSAEKRIE